VDLLFKITSEKAPWALQAQCVSLPGLYISLIFAGFPNPLLEIADPFTMFRNKFVNAKVSFILRRDGAQRQVWLIG